MKSTDCALVTRFQALQYSLMPSEVKALQHSTKQQRSNVTDVTDASLCQVTYNFSVEFCNMKDLFCCSRY
jgi:hypothetical protein